MSASFMDLPYISANLAGTGGVARARPEDFQVREIPAYEPSGEGDHVFIRIEKRGLTTFEAVSRIASALDIAPNDIGSAGLKDRHAITEQQLSLPPPCTPEQASTMAIDGLRVLSAARHPHKLRTGHLRGNRFVLTLREAHPEAETRARAILDELARAPGSPNWYGAQRFGVSADNHLVGRALVRGEKLSGRPPRGKKKRLMISSFQSHLFNDYLRRRIEAGDYREVIDGDVLQKPSGAAFVTDGASIDQPRLDAGEVTPTGPMFGPKMKSPAADSPASALEEAVLADSGASIADFARLGKLAPGARRAIAIPLGDAHAQATEPGVIEVSFQLPPGAYATAVLYELVKGSPC